MANRFAKNTLYGALLFDLDGTLADSAKDICMALRAAFHEIQAPVPDRLDLLVDGSPIDEVFAVAHPNGSPAEFSAFIDAYRRHYEESMLSHTRLFPGVVDTLEALSALSPRPRLVVATSKRQRTANALLQGLSILHHFDLVLGSGATSIPPKPAPDLLLTALETVGVAPHKALMIGDTWRDIQAGQRAGTHTAAVTYGVGPTETVLGAKPNYVLEEFDEILQVLGLDA